jgi:multiple sugar transport system permease protein
MTTPQATLPARVEPAPAAPVLRGPLQRRRDRIGLALTLPAFLVVLVFFFFPLVFAIYISFTDWPLVGPYHLIGGSNYIQLGHDPVFLHSVVFTLEYTAIITPLAFLAGYSLAILVRQKVRGVGFFRTVYFLPTVVGLSTISFMAILEFQPNSGVLDFVLSKLGLASGGTAWLAHSGTALAGICVLVIWTTTGLTMIILMAGMQAIPEEIYQAASVDGATKWKKEIHITFPLLRRSIALTLILSVIGSLLAFNQFYILTQGGPGTSTTTIVEWIYQVAFVQFHLGYATAMSIALLLAVLLISAFQFFLLRENT